METKSSMSMRRAVKRARDGISIVCKGQVVMVSFSKLANRNLYNVVNIIHTYTPYRVR